MSVKHTCNNKVTFTLKNYDCTCSPDAQVAYYRERTTNGGASVLDPIFVYCNDFCIHDSWHILRKTYQHSRIIFTAICNIDIHKTPKVLCIPILGSSVRKIRAQVSQRALDVKITSSLRCHFFVILTLMRRQHVASTSIQRHYVVMCLQSTSLCRRVPEILSVICTLPLKYMNKPG